MNERRQDFMLRLREALAASWDKRTAYLEVEERGNPALGQCYPTSRTVQHYYPLTEIIKGKVWTGKTIEVHFWNGVRIGQEWYHIDLTWQQFPPGSVIQEFRVIKRQELNDSEATKTRCALLLKRADDYIKAGAGVAILDGTRPAPNIQIQFHQKSIMDKNSREILEFIGRHADGVTFYQLVRGFGFPDAPYDLQEVLRYFIVENLTELTQQEDSVNSKYFITDAGMDHLLTKN